MSIIRQYTQCREVSAALRFQFSVLDLRVVTAIFNITPWEVLHLTQFCFIHMNKQIMFNDRNYLAGK